MIPGTVATAAADCPPQAAASLSHPETGSEQTVISARNLAEVLRLPSIRLRSWKGDYLHRPDSLQGVTTAAADDGALWRPVAGADGTLLLRSWKGDYLHRANAPEGVTTWNRGMGNHWRPEFQNGIVRLRSWKHDYLHRPEGPEGVSNWIDDPGTAWILEALATTVRFAADFPEGCPSASAPYVEAGLTFFNSNGNRWCSPFEHGFISCYGSPGQIDVQPEQGRLFSLLSLQICHLNAIVGSQQTQLIGQRPDGSCVTTTLSSKANRVTPQCFNTPAFNNLCGLSIKLGAISIGNLMIVT
jgi:hypothetical protein